MRKRAPSSAKESPSGHHPSRGSSGVTGSAAKKAVLLDAAGTLIDVARPVGETYAEIASRFGSTADEEALSRAFRGAWDTMPPLAFPDLAAFELEAAEYRWWKELVERTFAPVERLVRFDSCFESLYRHYADPRAWRVFPEVRETLRMLRERGIALAVVSNFDSRLPGLLDALGLAPFFQGIVHSSAAGAAKPAREIFDLALSLVGVEAERALHVGDSLTADFEGARAAGVDALLIERDTPSPHRHGINRHEIIGDLRMIEGFLDGSPRQ